uniref:Reverse transcriptase domain-containing protein n=1 Tax=Tanacetum cinerariifolium TaxID=118510 RepID=A0A699HMT2_TANCI|nr:reverse transcriptase domain-containing protein [Tanacetum cinerariifolium]
MHTRSSSNLIVESFTILKRHNCRGSKQIVKPELRTIVETPVANMVDTRTTSELLEAPTEGYGYAIVIPTILAKDFELKVGLLQLVTSSQFHGFERDDPHAHIRRFNKITSMLKYMNVPHDAIKLMLFSFSLEGASRTWLEKEPPRSIHTWEDLVYKFVNYLFLPSKTTNLKNDITNFQQRFDETFSEAWDHFKDLLRKCPHHDFLKLHQIDSFYNALTQSDQDSLNAAAGGNLLNCTPRDALTIIENKSKVHTSRNKPVVLKVNTTTFSSSPSPDITALTDVVKELVLMNKANQQAFVKAIEETCVICGGPHPYYECLAAGGNTFDACAAVRTYNQGGDKNPIRTLGDYFKPSHEGYRNTIKLLERNNVVPLRFDTIRLVQNRSSFHGLRSEDPNLHLKDFSFAIKLAIGLNVYQTAKLHNDILMFPQHQGESLSEAWTRFKDLLQKSLIMVSIFGSKSKSSMTMSIPSQDKPSINQLVIAQPGMNMNQDKQILMVKDNVGNQFRPNAVQIVGNQYGNGNVVSEPAEGNGNGINGIQSTQEEFEFMAVADAYKETERVKANCILENNLQQASTSGTQSDKAPVYDSDGSAEVHLSGNYYDNDIFNMFTQEEQYTELLEPIPKPHQVPHNDSNVISEVSSVEQEPDESLVKHKALELEIERLLRAVVSQDIMSVVQNNFVTDTSNLQTVLERTKERFENCIIKKENEYAKLWNDWYVSWKKAKEYMKI